MRRFRVYVEHGYAGCPPEEEILEFADDVSDEEIEKECKMCWEVMIGNMDSGWYELEESEE